MNLSVINGRLVTVPKINIINIGSDTIGLCCFTIASLDGEFDNTKQNDLHQENFDFFECVAFNGCAQRIAENFGKGSKLLCRGRFKNHSFEDVNGTKHFTQVFVVESVEFGDSESFLKKITAKPKKADISFVSDLRDMYYIFDNVCNDFSGLVYK